MASEDIFSINEPLYRKYASSEDVHLYNMELEKLNGIIVKYGQLLGPSLVEFINCKGIILEKLNHNGSAIEAFKNALSIDPSYIHSLISLAFTYGKINEYENSLEYYRLALHYRPDFSIVYKSRALIYRKEEKFDLALQDCDTALSLDPRNPDIISLKATFLLQLRRLGEAEKFITENLIHLKSSDFLYYTQGLLLAYKSRYTEALDHFNKFALNHKNAEAFLKIATCYYSLQDYDNFFKYIQIAKSFDQFNLDIIILELAYYINAGDYYTGIRLTEKYISEVGGQHVLYCKLAFLYRRIGFFDMAENAVLKAHAISKQNTGVLEELIIHYRELDDLEKALVYAKELTLISEFDGLKQCAAVYLSIENRKKTYQTSSPDLLDSFIHFTKAYSLYKNDSELLEIGAIIMSRANKYDEAIKMIDQAILLVPGRFTVYRTKANILHLHKQHELAAESYSTSISLNENNTDNYFNRGFCYHYLNQVSQAESDFLGSIVKYISNSINKAGLKLSKFKPANEYLLSSLRAEDIWFSHPSMFNDALDCNFLQDYWAQNTALMKSLDKVFVCCFRYLEPDEDAATSFFFNENLMWAHYADSYRGVQLIYEITDKKSPVSYRGDFVSYSDNLEMLSSEGNYDLVQSVNRTLRLGFFTKFKDWEYEKEFRLLTVPNADSKFIGYKLDDLGIRLSAIVFGLNCSAAFKKEVAAIISAYTYKVELIEIIKNLSALNHFTLLKKKYDPDEEN